MQIEQKNRNSGEIENPVTAILDKGAKFEGRLTFEGTVQIGGDFYGEIFTKDTLVIVNGAPSWISTWWILKKFIKLSTGELPRFGAIDFLGQSTGFGFPRGFARGYTQFLGF
jgi:hypothetical protein